MPASPSVRYAEQPPPEALAPYVRDRWGFRAGASQPPSTFTLPPDPCLSLAVIAEGPAVVLRIVGPRLEPLTVPIGPGSEVGGLRMRPEAAGLLTGLDPRAWVARLDAAADHLPDLAESVGRAGDIAAGMERLLQALAGRTGPFPDPLVSQAVARIESTRGELLMRDLADELGVSLRTLQRRFAAATGLSPKPYARLRRFLLAAGNVLRREPEAWGRVAAEHGYADQAHFARECAALTGASPTEFASQMLHVHHVDVRP